MIGAVFTNYISYSFMTATDSLRLELSIRRGCGRTHKPRSWATSPVKVRLVKTSELT